MLVKLLPSQSIPILKRAASRALSKNIFEGEKRSAIVKMAKSNVPEIKPNCTAEVRCPKALLFSSKLTTRSFITPFPANQSDVQQN